jgi:hypothetical protein
VVIDLIVNKLILKSKSTVVTFIGDCINVLYEVALSVELTLTLLFWTLLVGPDTKNLGGFDNLGVHLMPFLLLLVDFLFNSYQFPIRHFIFTFIVSAVYIIINQVHSCDSTPVYPVYECGNIWIPVVAFVILAATHMMGHLVWKFARGRKIQEQLMISESE